MTETISISETSAGSYQTTRGNNPDKNHLRTRRLENIFPTGVADWARKHISNRGNIIHKKTHSKNKCRPSRSECCRERTVYVISTHTSERVPPATGTSYQGNEQRSRHRRHWSATVLVSSRQYQDAATFVLADILRRRNLCVCMRGITSVHACVNTRSLRICASACSLSTDMHVHVRVCE